MKQSFSDETKTGRRKAFRDYGRAIVGARACDQDDFDWILALGKDHFKGVAELKFRHLQPLIETHPQVCKLVYDKVSSYSVFIVDMYEHVVCVGHSNASSLIRNGFVDLCISNAACGTRALACAIRVLLPGTAEGGCAT